MPTYNRLTDRTLATGVTLTDLIHIVITGDTSQNAAGSSYKATIAQLASILTGATGTAGTSGTNGTSGANGTSGTNGTSGVGTNGTSGSSGLSGTNGTSGSSGSSGTNGSSGINGTSGSSGSSGINGTSGSSGISGTSGSSGSSGISGTSGSSGSSGISGTSGSSGIDGTSGSSGLSGTSGSSGINGTSGSSGLSGTSGSSGSSGISGTSGSSGSSGLSGTSGSSGSSGTSGSSGLSGTNGTSGISGVDGTNGTSGTNGSSGINGSSGSSGISGSSGSSGTSGSSGSSGTSGSSGSSGTSGSSGSSGTSGSSGISGVFTGGTISGQTTFYSGLTANTIFTDYIDFNTGATVTAQTARLRWNNSDEIQGLEVGMGGGNVTLQVGEENLARVYNADSVTLTDGMIVYVYGNQGNTISVKRASASGETTSARVLGMVTESIPVGGRGFVNTFGLVRDLDTSSYTGGTPLYLGTTPGSFTNVQPESPNHICLIGYVSRSHASTGSIFIHVSNGWELDEIHNVAISGVTNGDLLSYDSSDSIWKNTKTLKGNYTITGNTVVGGSLTATTVSATSVSAITFNLSGSQIESAWTSYTPVWTASTSPSIGNGTIEGYYKLIGKTCFVRGNIAMGSTTTYGTGEWLVGLPFPAKHPDGIQITVSILHASVAWYNGIMNGARAGYSDKTAIQYQNVGGTSDSLSANTPFIWGTGSRFTWNGSYEIA